MLHALDQVLPTARNRFVNDLRIGEAEVGGADGIQELAQQERQLVLLLDVQPLNALHGLQPGRRGQQVALFERIEDRVLLPIRGAEAFIAGFRLDDRFAFLAQSPECEGAAGHQLTILQREVAVESPQPRRIAKDIQPDALEDTDNFPQINGHDLTDRIGIPEPVDEGDPGILLGAVLGLGEGLYDGSGRIASCRSISQVDPGLYNLCSVRCFFIHSG